MTGLPPVETWVAVGVWLWHDPDTDREPVATCETPGDAERLAARLSALGQELSLYRAALERMAGSDSPEAAYARELLTAAEHTHRGWF